MIRIVVATIMSSSDRGSSSSWARSTTWSSSAPASNGAEAADVCVATRPDVALLDLEMPVADGIEATGGSARKSPETNVVIFTSFSDRERILRALDAGAIGLSPEGRRAG